MENFTPDMEDKRVILAAFEDQPEQRGVILAIDEESETAIVELDAQYYDNEVDDGIREVDAEQCTLE